MVFFDSLYGILENFGFSELNKYSSTLQSEDFAVYLSKSIVLSAAENDSLLKVLLTLESKRKKAGA